MDIFSLVLGYALGIATHTIHVRSKRLGRNWKDVFKDTTAGPRPKFGAWLEKHYYPPQKKK